MTKYSQKKYTEVFSNAKTILKRPLYYLKIASSASCSEKKIIIVISKKNGNAVQRNKNKRIVKGVFERLQLFSVCNIVYIIIFSKKPVDLSFADFYLDCVSLQERVKNKKLL